MTPRGAIHLAQYPRASVAELRLVVMHEGVEVDRHVLREGRTVIGRDPRAGIFINSKYVSWKHAAVSFNIDGPFIVDLCSKNRTLVNDEEITRKMLRDGDTISIGYYKIFVRLIRNEAEEIDVQRDTTAIPHRRIVAGNDEGKQAARPDTRCNGRTIDTSADSFRTFVDSFQEDPDILANDVGTPAMKEDGLIDLAMDGIAGNKRPRTEGDSDEAAVAAMRPSIERGDVESAIAELDGEDKDAATELYEKFEGSESQLTAVLGDIFDYPTLSAHALMKCQPDFAYVTLSDARAHRCAVIVTDDKVSAAICDPFDPNLRPWLESRVPDTFQWVLVSPGDLNAYLSRHERSMRAMDSVVDAGSGDVGIDADVEDLSFASISQDSSPIVKLVHSTLYDALRAGASDVHMEAGNAALEVRYRIDGVLAHVATIRGVDVAEQVVSRLKVMSELDIAERRVPQDGRFKSTYEGRPIDFRVSIMPSSFGEDAVLRVLDKQAITDQMTALSLDSLGFADDIVESLRKLSERPYGMLLVTGPTGSGKTTTLYGAISETNSGLGKIVTIEDPVEYQLPGVLQIPVNEKKGLTFARGLRSILRHDPDKIMVGEIRDPETAQIAIQSALTGHLVFTTVHANNVFDVLSRFLHMGVDAYSFVSALNGILAQRLLRIVCHGCGEDIEPTPAMLDATGVARDVARTFRWRAGAGCSECRGTGFKGRKAIGELLVLDDELREAIIGREPVRKLKELANDKGVQFIRVAALNLVRDGFTTIEEVDRVTTMA